MDGGGPLDIMRKTITLARDAHYFVKTETSGKSKQLDRIFFAHPDAIKFFCAYHIYVGMDTTYKYGLPLLEFISIALTNQNFQIGFSLISDKTQDSYH